MQQYTTHIMVRYAAGHMHQCWEMMQCNAICTLLTLQSSHERNPGNIADMRSPGVNAGDVETLLLKLNSL